jgi:hypothetical protein
MAKLLMIVSGARTIRLADGSDHPTGYLAEEVLEPYEMFEAASVDVVIATPEGKLPQPDPWGFEPYFHYPKVDEDFMFSVLRRFAYHQDRVRVTFTHFSELNLVAVRRVYLALLDTGMEPAVARKAVESVAYRAWRGNIDFIQVLTQDDEVRGADHRDPGRGMAGQSGERPARDRRSLDDSRTAAPPLSGRADR